MANVTGDESANTEGSREHASDELTPIFAAGSFGGLGQKERDKNDRDDHPAKQENGEQQITERRHFA